uniref:Lipoprotein n=1 Tax=viral metagenome TaxID=1070528 RepID=A0A6C0EEV2_9ZZZZ
MNLITKQILIILFTFFITLWLQSCDDKKYNNQRLTFYDKYKLPIFFGAFVGFILNVFDFLYDNIICNPIEPNNSNNLYNQEIYIDTLYPKNNFLINN